MFKSWLAQSLLILVALNCCLGQTLPVTLTPECEKVDAANADYPPGTSGLVGCYPVGQTPPRTTVDPKCKAELEACNLPGASCTHLADCDVMVLTDPRDAMSGWKVVVDLPKPHRSSRVLRDQVIGDSTHCHTTRGRIYCSGPHGKDVLVGRGRSAKVRRDFQRQNPCPSTGKRYGACPGFVKDHVIPLCAGGPDAISNIQWQSVSEAKAKDRLERKECRK